MKPNFEKNGASYIVAGVAAGIAALALASGAKPATVSGERQQTPLDCIKFAGNLKQARACIEYTTLIVPRLTAYYKFGNHPSPDTSLKDLTEKEFEKRYDGPARKSIEATVDKWPDTVNQVDNSVKVIAVNVNAAERRAIIGTNEKWTVYGPNNEVRLKSNRIHVLTACNVSKTALDSYVIVKDTADDKFPCKTFSATKQKIDPKKVTTA